ncbi:YciI family protein [soil metagenome]
MHYSLLMHYQEGGDAGLTDADMAPAREAFARYAADLDEAGVLIGTQVLQGATVSTTFTARNGVPEIQDGPFADTKERLGGIFVIEVPDLDAALGWAAKCPAAQWGSIEIRPVAVTYAADKGGWYQP